MAPHLQHFPPERLWRICITLAGKLSRLDTLVVSLAILIGAQNLSLCACALKSSKTNGGIGGDTFFYTFRLLTLKKLENLLMWKR